jgi:hypothetical protein
MKPEASGVKQSFGCVGNTIRLRSGKYLDLLNPKPSDFEFADIAGGLSKICRFGGQCEFFYSVAEHSYHCATVAKEDGLSIEDQRAVLMHDAAEAFIGDVVKPLKIALPDYEIIETIMEECIVSRFDLGNTPLAFIKEIDQAMLIAERRRMFSKDSVEWVGENSVRRLNVDFHRWLPGEAEEMFAFRARELGFEIGHYVVPVQVRS